MAIGRDAQDAMALLSAVSQQDNDLLPEEYKRYFWTLILQKQNRDMMFSMFMHVQIVTEICEKLGIPCITSVHINEWHPVGNQFLCISDIIERLRHWKPGTFNNHCGWVHLACLCLECLEGYGHKESEKKFMQQVNDLLQKSSGYGK